MEKDIPVTLSGELIDKGILMNSSSTKDSTVEIYLVSEEAIDGELLAKAMNVKWIGNCPSQGGHELTER